MRGYDPLSLIERVKAYFFRREAQETESLGAGLMRHRKLMDLYLQTYGPARSKFIGDIRGLESKFGRITTFG